MSHMYIPRVLMSGHGLLGPQSPPPCWTIWSSNFSPWWSNLKIMAYHGFLVNMFSNFLVQKWCHFRCSSVFGPNATFYFGLQTQSLQRPFLNPRLRSWDLLLETSENLVAAGGWATPILSSLGRAKCVNFCSLSENRWTNLWRLKESATGNTLVQCAFWIAEWCQHRYTTWNDVSKKKQIWRDSWLVFSGFTTNMATWKTPFESSSGKQTVCYWKWP